MKKNFFLSRKMFEKLCLEPAVRSEECTQGPLSMPATAVTITTTCYVGPGAVGFLGSRLRRTLPH